MSTSPILLTSRVAIASGGTAIADSGRLQNESRRPMLIEEVHFLTQSPTTTLTTVTYSMGTVIRAKLRAGRFVISNEFIVLSAYGPLLQDLVGLTPGRLDRTLGIGLDAVTTRSQMTHHRWKLSRPLLLGPGESMMANFSRDVDVSGWTGGDGNAFVTITLLGRLADPSYIVPKKVMVPYISQFLVTETAMATAGDSLSQETDIGNPFLVPLQITSMNGRLRTRSTTAIGDLPFDNNAMNIDPTDGREIKMAVSGRNMIRDYTSISSVFGNTRSWEMDLKLDPREWVNAGYRRGSSSSGLQFTLTAFGHREETL